MSPVDKGETQQYPGVAHSTCPYGYSGPMGDEAPEAESEEVSPLELFFDLVFVFALSQLSVYLLEHHDLRGAVETAILLVAIYTVWSYTSFEATLLQVSRARTRWFVLLVMLLGLFMNASVGRAWADGGWWFVVPFLVCQLGHGVITTWTAPDKMLREHYAVMLGWIVVSAPLWIAGAAAGSDARLWWWGAAAVIDLVGAWFAHPVPGRKLESANVEFDVDHMVERCRLFLLIALGETVLTTGTALSHEPFALMTVMTGSLSLITIIALWLLYFGGSDHHVDQHLEETSDPIRTARFAMNGQVVVVAGLISLAVGQEIVVAHPDEHTSVALGLLLFGGALAYLLTQTWYVRLATGELSQRHLVGAGALVLAGGGALLLPAYGALALVAAVLVAVTGSALREPSAAR